MSVAIRSGTIDISNGSSTVSGTGTDFVQDRVESGFTLYADRGGASLEYIGEVASVQNATQLTIVETFGGTTLSDVDYALVNTGGVRLGLRDKISDLITTINGYISGALAGRFGNGNAGEPGVSFADSIGMGLFRKSASILGISTGGVQRVQLSASAMQVDVPITGTAVVQNDTDTTSGRIPTVGWMGLGGEAEALPSNDTDNVEATGFWRVNSNTANTLFSGTSAIMSIRSFSTLMELHIGANRLAFRRNAVGGATGTWAECWTTENTTVDGSGFILEASPILRLYNDGLEEPNQPAGGALSRESEGVYKISGVHPLAGTGWKIRTPEDENGNKLVAIEPPEYDEATETLTVKTFDLLWHEGRLVPGDPMDIPEGEFVMLRFEEPETETG